MSHYIKQCKKCGDIISQCRCPSTDKTITFDLCNRCKVVVLEDEIRAVINSIPEDYRVIVREGAGEENIVATLSVSVAKLIHKVEQK
jgi:hypothetical protein